jgi:DNA-directed RNA polymerase specialized sigma24 family protein
MFSDSPQQTHRTGIGDVSSKSGSHTARGSKAVEVRTVPPEDIGAAPTCSIPGGLQSIEGNSETAQRTYKTLRARLISYFRQNACSDPEDLADEVFSRLSTRLAQGVEIHSGMAQYCYGIARYLLKEEKRRSRPMFFAEVPEPRNVEPPHKLNKIEQLLLLRRCLKDLSDHDRELFSRYYLDDRAELATENGLTTNNLKTRVFRIKQRAKSAPTLRPEGLSTFVSTPHAARLRTILR